MGRPRTFVADDVLDTVMEVFWERGYQSTALVDLEDATGLNRSSLYHAFGTKEALFQGALDRYIETVIPSFLDGMEGSGATIEDVERFFRGLGRRFREGTPLAARGCLWVNSIVEFAGDPAPVDARSLEYRSRLRAAFTNALADVGRRGAADSATIDRRARMLVAATIGVWVAARIDSQQAARTCVAIAAEVRSWKVPVQHTT